MLSPLHLCKGSYCVDLLTKECGLHRVDHSSRSNSFLLFSFGSCFCLPNQPLIIFPPPPASSIDPTFLWFNFLLFLSVREAISHRSSKQICLFRGSLPATNIPHTYSLGNNTSYHHCVFLDGFHSLNTTYKHISLHIGISKLSCFGQKPFLWMSRSTTRCPFHFRI